ncbi:hypothetical protein C8Q78DRAFT_1003568 [Trametes maxima]|nr:hypothetical protein C8Q78DRAFT_1003568 [Trametes maxima]
MASGVRSRKSTSTPELEVSNLNNVERLIFAQAVHEFGTKAWPEVAKLLSNHPLILQPKGAFTAQSCPLLHRRLMEDAGLEWAETDVGPRSEKHLKLAQRYYVARVTELRGLIAAEEAKFKTLVTEIDEIRSGSWDDKIRASLGIEPEKDTQIEDSGAQPPHAEDNVPAPTIEEITTVAEPPPPEAVSEEAEGEAEGEMAEPLAVQEEAFTVEEEVHPAPESEEKEEGSDNEAVDELIGNYTSEKPPAELLEDAITVTLEENPEENPEEGSVERMDVDESAEPVDVATPPPAESAREEIALQEPESPDVPISMVQEAASSSRAEGKRKVSDADSLTFDAQRERKRPREDSEPADEDEAPRGRRRGGPDGTVSKRFQNVIGMVHSQISQHRYGNIFHNPIKKSEAPDYHDIVKRPMDLKTIKSRVKDGLIANSLEFQRDIYLMFANAMMYNRPGSEIYNMAEEMMLSSERDINAFRQTEGFHRM